MQPLPVLTPQSNTQKFLFALYLKSPSQIYKVRCKKNFCWGTACEGHNSQLTSGGQGCVEARPISPVNIGRFEFFKAQNTQNKK